LTLLGQGDNGHEQTLLASPMGIGEALRNWAEQWEC
jgi:hypothetical protein